MNIKEIINLISYKHKYWKGQCKHICLLCEYKNKCYQEMQEEQRIEYDKWLAEIYTK